MKRIVVIGNSPAGVKALETIRTADPESDLTIFALEGVYPYQRELFADFFLKRIKESQIFYKPQEFYQTHRINVILERQISRVNFRKRKIFTEEKDQIDFDILLITDTPQIKLPDIKGTGKNGVFVPRRLGDFKKMISALPLVDSVVIESNSLDGLRLADALKKKEKEVILVVPSQGIFSEWMDEATAATLAQALEESGIRLLTDTSIAEILGDSEMKAIRLKSGKVMASEMAILTDAPPDLRLFADTELKIDQRILVDSSFRTNVEGVFALDCAARFKEEQRSIYDITALSRLEEAGKIVALNIAGENISFCPSFHPIEIMIGNCNPIAILGLKGKTDKKWDQPQPCPVDVSSKV